MNSCVKIIWKYSNFWGMVYYKYDWDFLTYFKRILTYFKSFSEEVFDFSSGQMTQAKAKNLKESMNNEFQQVFQLCTFIMVISNLKAIINLKPLSNLNLDYRFQKIDEKWVNKQVFQILCKFCITYLFQNPINKWLVPSKYVLYPLINFLALQNRLYAL